MLQFILPAPARGQLVTIDQQLPLISLLPRRVLRGKLSFTSRSRARIPSRFLRVPGWLRSGRSPSTPQTQLRQRHKPVLCRDSSPTRTAPTALKNARFSSQPFSSPFFNKKTQKTRFLYPPNPNPKSAEGRGMLLIYSIAKLPIYPILLEYRRNPAISCLFIFQGAFGDLTPWGAPHDSLSGGANQARNGTV